MPNPYAPRPSGAPGPDPDEVEAHRASVAAREHGDGPDPATGGRPGRPPRRPVDPEAARQGTRLVLWFGLLMLASLLATALPLPWRLGGLAVVGAAVVLGVRALRRTWRAGVRGTMTFALSAGLVATLGLGATILAVIPVWDVETERQDCMDRAITLTARSSCQKAYDDAITAWLDSLSR
ncbi:hypothetical protein [Sanguibacter suaedae]|uniref:DUF4190 domain-containing protein n=1 Tax=Sanguibacter suaedae TaxID=2795737 RepID=A0A934I4N6_9MICO|nr:hypothetical protein [Sanguibacter suaedae]MBI9114151.1 hypothetical protein [Sanguibacter suaedae]